MTVKADTTCATTVANMHSSTSTRMRSHVLLKTVVAPVSSDGKQFVSKHSFLWGRSTQFYYTRDGKQFEFKTSSRILITVTISGFGESNRKVRYLDIVTIQMKTQSAELIPIDVLIVPQIGQPIQTYDIWSFTDRACRNWMCDKWQADNVHFIYNRWLHLSYFMDEKYHHMIFRRKIMTTETV